MARRQAKRRSPQFPSNQRIATSILTSKYGHVKIRGLAFEIKRTYNMSDETMEDLKSRAVLHLYRTDWRGVLMSGGLRPRLADRRHLDRLVAFLANYAVITIRNAMIDEARRCLSGGIGGLTAKKMAEMPFMQDIPNQDSDEAEDPTKIEEAHHENLLTPDAEQQAMFAQSLRLAERILTVKEFQCVTLAFGFDGGGERSSHQLAKDMSIPRPEAEQLLAGAMKKLREAVCNTAKSNGAIPKVPSPSQTGTGSSVTVLRPSSTAASGTAMSITTSSQTRRTRS